MNGMLTKSVSRTTQTMMQRCHFLAFSTFVEQLVADDADDVGVAEPALSHGLGGETIVVEDCDANWRWESGGRGVVLAIAFLVESRVVMQYNPGV